MGVEHQSRLGVFPKLGGAGRLSFSEVGPCSELRSVRHRQLDSSHPNCDFLTKLPNLSDRFPIFAWEIALYLLDGSLQSAHSNMVSVSTLLVLPWWGWLSVLAAIPIAVVVFIVAKATIVYQYHKRKLPSNMPRHPATLMVVDLYDVSKPVDLYLDAMKDRNTGGYYPVVNAGPYLEKPYLFVADPDALKLILTSNDVDHFPKLRETYGS